MAGVNESNLVEMKIATMDRQTYTIRTGKSVPVPTLKEQIAQVTGVVSDHQRLLFAGKVLKDDQNLSTYHVEDGQTLHLVVQEPVDPSFSTSMQRFDRMIEKYRHDFHVKTVVPRAHLDSTRSDLLHSMEFYRDELQGKLEGIRQLETAKETLLGLMLRGPAPEGLQLGRLRTGLGDVQNHLNHARLDLLSLESLFETSMETILLSIMLDQMRSENGGPENYQASADDEESPSSSAGNWLSVSFHRCVSWFCHRR